MVGNVCLLYVPGFYYFVQIVEYIDTNTVRMDRAAAGTGSNRSLYVGGAYKFGANSDTEFAGSVADGNVLWIGGGVHSPIEVLSPASKCSVFGYGTSRGDSPVGDSRPLLDFGNLSLNSGVVTLGINFRHIRVRGSNLTSVVGGFQDSSGIAYNCQFIEDGAVANRRACSLDSGTYILCDFVSTLGYGARGGGYFALYCCVFRDSNEGLRIETASFSASTHIIQHCVFTRNTTAGLRVTGNYGRMRVVGNIFYNNGAGILRTDTSNYQLDLINNIIAKNTVGVDYSIDPNRLHSMHNCWWDNGVDGANVVKGIGDISANPLMVDPDNDDYRLQNGSPCFDAGLMLGAMVGL
jgi:hypothetical protein